MEKPIENFWSLRLADLKDALEANNFEVHIAENAEAAKKIVKEIVPRTGAKSLSVGWFHDVCANRPVPGVEGLSRHRDTRHLPEGAFTGGNGRTEKTRAPGRSLYHRDKRGNRDRKTGQPRHAWQQVAVVTFGPRTVLILAGRNKVVPDIEDAMLRIKNFAAPANAMRLDKKTPCVKTSICEECESPERICNSWTITEKSFPKGRIIVVLINEDLGL